MHNSNWLTDRVTLQVLQTERYVTMLRDNVDKPKSSNAQIGVFLRKKEEEKFEQTVYAHYKLDKFTYLLDIMNSLYNKEIAHQSICNVRKRIIAPFHLSSFFSTQMKMSRNIGENRNFLFQLKLKLGFYHVILTFPKTSPEKLTLTATEVQQLPDIAKTDPEQDFSCLKCPVYNDGRENFVNFKTETDKLNIVVYRYRNNSQLRDNAVDLKLR